MLKELYYNYFKSHKETRLKLHEGVNVVIGLPDSGKSNLLRGFGWLAFNRPLGYPAKIKPEFSKEDHSKVGVKLINPNVEVWLEKGKEGKYGLHDQEFKGFNKDVPDEIKQALNIDEINFSEQIGLPFLLWNTPGEVGKFLNKIMRLDKADTWISTLTTDVNFFNREIKLNEAQSREKEVQIKELKYIKDLEEELIIIEDLAGQYIRLDKDANGLEELLDDYEEVNKEIDNLEEWLKCEDGVNELESLIIRLIKLENEEVLINEYLDVSSAIESKMEIVQLEGELGKVEALAEEFKEKKGEERQLGDLLGLLESYENKIFEYEDQLESLILQYKEELEKLGKCPFCDSDISAEKIEEIIREV